MIMGTFIDFRRSDESEIVVPPGYTELYSKDSGLISYHDNVRDVTWHTALDEGGRLYFYTEDGLRSEWQLPKVPSDLEPCQINVKDVHGLLTHH